MNVIENNAPETAVETSEGNAPAVVGQDVAIPGDVSGLVTFTTEGMNEADAREYSEFMAACAVKGKPRFRRVALAEAYSEGNPRVNYDLKPLIVSILREGFRDNEPLMLAETDRGFLVLRGNRRYFAAVWILRNKPEEAARIFPQGTIPAVVYSGLSEKDVEILRQDFDNKAGKKNLNDWETFQAVRGLVRVGFLSEAAIAARLGRYKEKDGKLVGDRSFIQPLANLATLPKDVQAAFQPVLERPEGWQEKTGLRKAAIMRLAKVFRENGDGEAFRAALATEAAIKPHGNAGPATAAAADPAPAYGATVKSLMERLNSFGSETLRTIIERIATGEALADIDDALTAFDAVKGSPEYVALAEAYKPAAIDPAADSSIVLD